MDLLSTAAQLFKSNLSGGDGLDIGSITSALQKLLPTNGGELDLQGLLSMVQSGGLADMASSWLGDGGNESMSESQLTDALGQENVEKFSNDLGIDSSEAASGLSGMLPQLIDKASEGGGLMGAASSIAGKFFG